jgi:hypothetical protein
MLEGRRQSYLAALGLPLWGLRRLLPGAMSAEPVDFVPYEDEAGVAAPVEFVAGGTEATPEPAAATTAALAAPSPQERPSSPAVREMAPPPPRPTPSPTSSPIRPPAQAVASALAGSADFPRFCFWFKPLPSGWQLLIALGDVPDVSAREHQLLEQIETVLGGSSAAPTIFNWPLNNNPAIPRDAQSACEAVGAFLGRQRKPGARYLLLGRELLPYTQAGFAGGPFAVGDSLPLLLAEPVRKRALWLSLSEQLA